MKFVSPGKHKGVEALRAHLAEVAAALGRPGELDCAETVPAGDSALGAALEVDGLRIGNRFCVHPMEGWDGTLDGGPSDLTLRRWRRFGESGAKLIWGGEAFAVQADGRANPNQLCATPTRDVEADLARLRAAVLDAHAAAFGATDDLVLGLQLTHSGRWSRPTADGPAPRIGWWHAVLDGRMGLRPDDPATQPLTDGELEAIGERYVEVAKAANAVGFDFVDVKCCHGYLLHELLGARERPGPYGGDLAGRARLLLRIVDAIRAEVPDLRIGSRISAVDVAVHGPRAGDGVGEPVGRAPGEPPRSGFGVHPTDPSDYAIDEPATVMGWLAERGVRLFNVSIGSPYTCPHLQRPATYPPVDGYLPPEDPLQSVARHLFLVRDLRRAVPGAVVVGTGYSYLQEWLAHVAEHELAAGHVDAIGLGRMVLSYPGLPTDVLAGESLERRLLCRTFSDCTNAPRKGLVSGCYPLDPFYKQRPERETLEAHKRAARARRNEIPS